jgi:hypothetical protein
MPKFVFNADNPGDRKALNHALEHPQDFFSTMAQHVTNCHNCTDDFFCDAAIAIMRAEFPAIVEIHVPRPEDSHEA